MTERSNFSTVDGVRVARKDHYGRNEHPGYHGYQRDPLNQTKSSVTTSKKKPKKKSGKKSPQYG